MNLSVVSNFLGSLQYVSYIYMILFFGLVCSIELRTFVPPELPESYIFLKVSSFLVEVVLVCANCELVAGEQRLYNFNSSIQEKIEDLVNLL